MIEKESCPLCDCETRAECSNCNATGEIDISPVGTQPEGAIYNLFCACGSTKKVVFTENLGPLDLEGLLSSKCSCGLQFQSEIVGWGSA